MRTSQSFTCLSQLEVTTTLPSLENAEDVTQLLCARSEDRKRQPAVSQIFAEPSFEDVVKRAPSVENWSEFTQDEWGVKITRCDRTETSVFIILPALFPEKMTSVVGVTAMHVRGSLPPLKSVRRYLEVIWCTWIFPSVPQLTRFSVPCTKSQDVSPVFGTLSECKQSGSILLWTFKNSRLLPRATF